MQLLLFMARASILQVLFARTMWRIYVSVLTGIFVIWLYIFHIRHKTIDSPIIYDESGRKLEHHIPKFMLELYNEIQSSSNITTPDVVKSIIPKNQEFELTGKLNKQNNHLLLFEIPNTDVNERFVEAELKILTLVEDNSKSKSNLNSLDHLVVISIYDDVENILIPIERKHVLHKNNTWLSFNLTSVVEKIIQKNILYLKLVISLKPFVPTLNGKLKLSLLPAQENYEHDYPILLLTYKSKERETFRRNKRNIEQSDLFERKFKNSCKKRPLYVNFSEIYYDRWIVQPRGYEAFQCQGKCFYPLANHLSPTKHAVIQSLMYNLHPTKVAKICCVPTKLTSISILYVEGGILTFRYAYKDMVVTECGCR